MTTQRLLPADFASLEPYVTQWALPGSAARAALRGSSTADDRSAFYEAAQGHLVRALDYLDAKGLTGLDEADKRLLNLMLSLGHVALAVEQQKEAEPVHTGFRAHMRITRSPAGA